MKRNIICIFSLLVLFIIANITLSLAACYKGNIWTGKPNSLGIGYYCTAAKNESCGDTSTHWSHAKTWTDPTGKPVEAYSTGNNKAVASTGKATPSKGWGAYGEKGWQTSGRFHARAWK